jgi:SAM-dependent methyltransferase
VSVKDELANLGAHYSRLFATHGDSPEAAQWRDRSSQEVRLEVLAGVGDLRDAKILDFGCGTGHLCAMLDAKGLRCEYVGYDLSQPMIDFARQKHPRARFECRDVLSEGVAEDFDYVLISGVFNNQVSDNWTLMTSLLRTLWPHARRGLAFNNLSNYVDFLDEGLFYVEPERVFRFCKEQLSPCVTLRHDYLVKAGVVPFEFTTYVYRTGIDCRPAIATGG